MVTTTTPRRARRSPSNTDCVPAPTTFPPPGIHTMTGRAPGAGQSAVHTFRNRQSSLAVLTAPPLIGLGGCAQIAPKDVASRTSDHRSTGIGSRQRRPPIGGAANGIPLNTAPPAASAAPRIWPPVTLTIRVDWEPVASMATTMTSATIRARIRCSPQRRLHQLVL